VLQGVKGVRVISSGSEIKPRQGGTRMAGFTRTEAEQEIIKKVEGTHKVSGVRVEWHEFKQVVFPTGLMGQVGKFLLWVPGFNAREFTFCGEQHGGWNMF